MPKVSEAKTGRYEKLRQVRMAVILRVKARHRQLECACVPVASVEETPLKRKRIVRTAEVTIETEEVVLHGSTNRHSTSMWCPACRRRVEMITPEQAAQIAGVSTRMIYRWIESGTVHFIADCTHVLICHRAPGRWIGILRKAVSLFLVFLLCDLRLAGQPPAPNPPQQGQGQEAQGQGAANGSVATANAAGADQVRAAAINAGATPAQADAAVNAFNQGMVDNAGVPSNVYAPVYSAAIDAGATEAQANAAAEAARAAAEAQFSSLHFGDGSSPSTSSSPKDPCEDQIEFTPPPKGPGPMTITIDGTDVTIDPTVPAGNAPAQGAQVATNQQQGTANAAVTAAITAGADQVRMAAINAGLTTRQADRARNLFLGYASGYSALSGGYVDAVANYIAGAIGETTTAQGQTQSVVATQAQTDAIKNAALIAARNVQAAAKLPPGAKIINGVTYYPLDLTQVAFNNAARQVLDVLAREKITGPWVLTIGYQRNRWGALVERADGSLATEVSPVAPYVPQAAVLVQAIVLSELAQARADANQLIDQIQNMTDGQKLAFIAQLQKQASEVQQKYSAYQFYKDLKNNPEYKHQLVYGDASTIKQMWMNSATARMEYIHALGTSPLLATQLQTGGPHFFDVILESTSPADQVAALNKYTAAYRNHIAGSFNRINGFTTMDQFIEFGSDQYAQAAQLAIAQGGEFAQQLITGLQATYQASQALKAADQALDDTISAICSAIPVAGMPFIIAQIDSAGIKYYVAVSNEQNAQEMLPVTGAGALVNATEARKAAGTAFATSAVINTVFIAIQIVPGAARGTRVAYRTLRPGAEGAVVAEANAAAGAASATNEARAGGRVAGAAAEADQSLAAAQRAFANGELAVELPGGRIPVVTNTVNPGTILGRIDTEALQGTFGRSNATNFRNFPPVRTMQAGGYTYHVSKPFMLPAPEGAKFAVIAYEETANGTVIPRSWYLSGEHGMWRAATGAPSVGGLLGKGPSRPVDFNAMARGETVELGGFANENSSNVLIELQSPLDNLVADVPPPQVSTLDPQAVQQGVDAFYGGLTRRPGVGLDPPGLTPFQSVADVQLPLPDPFQEGTTSPDFANGILQRSTLPANHPLYPGAERFLVRSENGQQLYMAIRTADGKMVFTPDVQNAFEVPTPFGTRTGAYLTDLTDVPYYKPEPEVVEPGQSPQSPYERQEYTNRLNREFAQNLPPRGSTGVRGTNVPATPNAPNAGFNPHETQVLPSVPFTQGSAPGPGVSQVQPNPAVDPRTGAAVNQQGVMPLTGTRLGRMNVGTIQNQPIPMPISPAAGQAPKFSSNLGQAVPPGMQKQAAFIGWLMQITNFKIPDSNNQPPPPGPLPGWMKQDQKQGQQPNPNPNESPQPQQAPQNSPKNSFGFNLGDQPSNGSIQLASFPVGSGGRYSYRRKVDCDEHYTVEREQDYNPITQQESTRETVYSGSGPNAQVVWLGETKTPYQGSGQSADTTSWVYDPGSRTWTLTTNYVNDRNALLSTGIRSRFASITPISITCHDTAPTIPGTFSPGCTLSGSQFTIQPKLSISGVVPYRGVDPGPQDFVARGSLDFDDHMTPSPDPNVLGDAGSTGAPQPSDLAVSDADFLEGLLEPVSLRGITSFSAFVGSSVEPENQGSGAPLPASAKATQSFTYSLVANGKSTGESFAVQVLDPTGVVKTIHIPEGTVFEPLLPDTTKPLGASMGGNVVAQPQDAFCLDFHKPPPAPGTVYRIADPAVQQKFRPMRFVLQATRELYQGKKLHIVGNPKAYGDALANFSLWAILEKWGREQFIENIVQRSKKNADEMHVKWTPEMENGLRGVLPAMWNDVLKVRDDAKFLEQLSDARAQARR